MTFYVKRAYFLEDENGPFPQRISSVVRGQQIAEYLGAGLNEDKGSPYIYVKPRRMDRVKDGDYVDVLDDLAVTEIVKARPRVKVLAMTKPHLEWLGTILKNQIVHIPHQHMNFERAIRERKEVTTCGYVGANNAFHKRVNREVGKRLEEAGFKFVSLFNFQTREDIINFYKSIDIQVIGYFNYHNVPYYHEKKIVDAMSFGIPTIAGPKLGYRDVDDFYVHANNMDELIKEALNLKAGWDADRLIKKAEEYHISNIAKLYENL